MPAVVERELERTAHARTGPFPRVFRPQLATLVSVPPEGDEWVHEIKYDGYRIGALVERGKVHLMSRNEKDWTARFPTVAIAVARLPLDRAVIDGEVVALDAEGRPDFQALQNAMGIEGVRPSTRPVIVYYVFDLPYCEGYDLKRSPLVERKRILAKLVEADAERPRRAIYFSEHVVGRGRDVWESACGSGLEGIVSKRADSTYEPRRTRTWLKVKCVRRQEVVIGGFTDPQGSREGFGSLLVGYYDDDAQLIFCGAVGTGFDSKLLRSLYLELKAREIERSPFVNPPPRLRGARGMRWVRPELVAEVEFTEWTADGILRHPSFKGLRRDKAPETVRREMPARAGGVARGASGATKNVLSKRPARSRGGKAITQIGSVRVSRPGRVLWPDLGITKRELIEYWHAVADRALPEIAGRPLSLLRCPEGTEGECFWQKQRMETMPDAILGVDLEDDGEMRTYIAIDSREGLLSLAQLGALEIHPWGSRIDALERPDRVIFDLDPGPGTTWSDVTTAAHELRAFLEKLGLVSVARVTGGKGLHVIVPLARRQGWDEVKGFARGVANTFSRGAPRRFTAVATKARRTGRIYIDWLRNSRGATAIATWSPRARPGAPIAVPVGWDEVGPELRPDGFDFDRARRRASEPDPWKNALSRRQTITPRRLEAVGE